MSIFKRLIKIFSGFIILYGIEGGSSDVDKTITQENNDTGDILEGNEKISIIPKNIDKKLEEAGLSNENKEKFEDFLIDNPDLAGKLIIAIEKSPSGKLKNYIKKNGIVVDEITYHAFAKNFNKNLLEESIENNEESNEKKEEIKEDKKESFNKFLELGKKNIINDEGFRKLFEKGKVLEYKLNTNDLNNESIKLINNEINKLQDDLIVYLSKKGVTQKIAQELYDSGDKENYESFKNFAVGLNDPSIRLEIKKFEESLKGTDKDLVVEAMAMSGLINTSNVEKNGSILSSKFDGKEILIDTGDIPPSRYISLEGSDYNMETELPIANFYKAIANEGLEYEKSVKNMNSTLSVMGIVESVKIEAEDYEKESFNTLVVGISQSIGVNLDELKKILNDNGITSNEGLKFYIENKGFEKLEDKLQKEVEKKKKAYQYALKDQINIYRTLLAEQDKKTEETLKSINRIGFDLIPQGVSDDVINKINSNNTIKLLGFQSKIDIENGNMGTNFDTDINKISIKEIQKFTELMNIMITGSKDYPVVIDSLTSVGKPIFKNEDGEQISDANLKIFINDKLGGNPKSRAMLNVDNYLKSGDVTEDKIVKKKK